MNTSNYFFWNNLFSSQEIKNINSLLKKYKKEKEQPSLKAEGSKKTSNVYNIKMKHLSKYLNKVISKIIKNNQDNYGYDLFKIDGEELLNYNIYKQGEQYEWHIDAAGFKSSDIKLTALINISDDSFSGGNFNLLASNNPVLVPELNNPGSMIIFNSFILHKVDPVIKGTRKTITIFMKGPAFK
jgi:PKHD-type hydroxylase